MRAGESSQRDARSGGSVMPRLESTGAPAEFIVVAPDEIGHVATARRSQTTLQRRHAARPPDRRWSGTFRAGTWFVEPRFSAWHFGSRALIDGRAARVWLGEKRHSAVPLRRTQPPRNVRHETARRGRGARPAQADRVVASRLRRLRTSAAHGPGDGPRHRGPFAHASMEL